ncbi:MAG: hypothetical protein HGA37_01735 [Lentimicrobium sp.]|nr:hypothetical protein [Lentimicrobium sp.]
MRRIFSFLLFSLITSSLSAQNIIKLADNQDILQLLDSTRKVKSDSVRMELNQEFYDKLLNFVSAHSSEEINFDSINMGNVVSDDGIIRILSWNVQQNNGDNYYGGLIFHRNLKKVIPLKIKKSELTLSGDKLFKDGDWPPGIYYRIIQRKINTGINYTVLSWDGLSRKIARKSIEVISFDDKGNVVFGAPVFKTKEGLKNRVVNEYSANASFSLNYNRQKVTLSGVRRSQRKVDDEMIVMDRLIPLNEELKDQRWAYVPAGNTYDAYIFLDGFWILTEDIVARNEPTPKTETTRRKNLELDLLPKE